MPELKDLIVLGQGTPNKLKDGRVSRCICAYSKNIGYVRLYPLPNNLLRKWDIFDAVVEKNPQDHRENTWKIIRSKENWTDLGKWVTRKEILAKENRYPLIKSLAKDTLSDLINNKKSFGIIKPKIIGFELEQRREKTSIQKSLIDPEYQLIEQKDYKYQPYVKYECIGECGCKNKEHRQQIVEWGCFEWMRKKPDDPNHCVKVFENLQLTNNEFDKFFLVGNIFKHPKTYVVVDVLRFKK